MNSNLLFMFPWARTKLNLINLISKSTKNTSSSKDNNTMQIKISNCIKLNIINSDGDLWILDISESSTISDILSMAVLHFYNIEIKSTNTNSNSNTNSNYKLISVSKTISLDDNLILQDSGLETNDELLLIEKNKTISSPINKPCMKPPSKRQILEATRNIESKHIKPPVPLIQDYFDTEPDMRKVFITLIEISAKILSVREDANQIYDIIVEKIDSKLDVAPDKELIKKFQNMGFSQEKIIIALKLKRNNTAETLEWLLDLNNKNIEDYSHIVNEINRKSNKNNIKLLHNSSSQSQSSCYSLYDKIVFILSDYKRKRLFEFKYDDDIIHNIKEMGFNEQEVKDALRITNNNQILACQWLVGDRIPSIEDLDKSLDSNHPIYKELVSNPIVMLGLGNPKLLLALLCIIDNSHSSTIWMQDTEIAPIINTIIRISESEKYILNVNKHFEHYNNTNNLSTMSINN